MFPAPPMRGLCHKWTISISRSRPFRILLFPLTRLSYFPRSSSLYVFSVIVPHYLIKLQLPSDPLSCRPTSHPFCPRSRILFRPTGPERVSRRCKRWMECKSSLFSSRNTFWRVVAFFRVHMLTVVRIWLVALPTMPNGPIKAVHIHVMTCLPPSSLNKTKLARNVNLGGAGVFPEFVEGSSRHGTFMIFVSHSDKSNNDHASVFQKHPSDIIRLLT